MSHVIFVNLGSSPATFHKFPTLNSLHKTPLFSVFAPVSPSHLCLISLIDIPLFLFAFLSILDDEWEDDDDEDNNSSTSSEGQMEAGGSHEDLGVLEGAENFTLPSEVKDKS